MRSFLSLAAFLGILACSAAGHADTFSFLSVGSIAGYSGSGTLVATNNGDGSYTITGISGPGITGLVAASSTTTGPDNLLFPGATLLLDRRGLSFFTANYGSTQYVNLSSNPSGYYSPSGYESIIEDAVDDYNEGPINFSIANTTTAVTPEPSSLLLLGTGILSLGGMARRGLRRS